MGIKVTLYDLFAYTIPGGFYIATFTYLNAVLGVIPFDLNKLNDLGWFQIIALIIISYVTGLVFDPISRPWYYRFFSKSYNQESLDFVNSSSDLQITTKHNRWGVLHQYIRIQENSNADHVDRFQATVLLLRNLSFCLFLASIITIILIVQTRFYIWNILLCFALFTLSILAGREATRFHRWFYLAIYGTIAAYGSKPSDFVAKQRQKKEQSKNKSA